MPSVQPDHNLLRQGCDERDNQMRLVPPPPQHEAKRVPPHPRKLGVAPSLKTWLKTFSVTSPRFQTGGAARVPEGGDVEQSPQQAREGRGAWVCVAGRAPMVSLQQNLAILTDSETVPVCKTSA